MGISGVRLDGQTPVTLPAGTKLRALGERIVVKALDWQPSSLLITPQGERKTERGVVVAVGPGTHAWRYNRDRSQRTRSKAFRPTDVKVGDTVQLEPDRDHFWVLIGNERHILCSEQDVCGVE